MKAPVAVAGCCPLVCSPQKKTRWPLRAHAVADGPRTTAPYTNDFREPESYRLSTNQWQLPASALRPS